MDFEKKKEKVAELGKMISLYNGLVGRVQGKKIRKLQDELSITLREMEEEAMDLKIKSMEKVLYLLHGRK
jgi:uncharacterized protein YkvS